MESQKKNKKLQAGLKWVRIIIAIAASVLLLNKPVFKCPDEPGLQSNRIYIMTPHTFEVHHIDMTTGLDKLMGTMSVKGLFYGALAILIGCVLCAIFNDEPPLLFLASRITAFLAGVYYLIIMYYAIQISQDFYAIVYPNFITFLPVVVLIAMLTLRKEGEQESSSDK